MNTLNLLKRGFLMLAGLFITAGAYAQTQTITDKELKTNTTPLTNSLSFINRLQPLTFEYNKEKSGKLKLPSGQQYGFLAEDVQKVLPSIVKSENKMVPAGKNAFKTASVKTVDLESLIPILVSSIQEQQAEIEKLREEVRSLRTLTARE